MTIPIAYSPSGDVSVVDNDALYLLAQGASGNALAAQTAAGTALTVATSAQTAVAVVATSAANAQATANTALTTANTAEADAQAALTAAANGLTTAKVYQVYNVANPLYGALGGSHDDTTAVQAASNAAAITGGILFFPFKCLVSSDITVPRNVDIKGSGAGRSGLRAASQVRLKIVGAADNDAHVIEGMDFDTVQVAYGVTNADQGRGCQLVGCRVQNCDKGVYYGFNCYVTAIIRSWILNCDDGVYFDFATAGSNAGAFMVIDSGSKVTNCINAVTVNGNTSDGHHIVIGADLEHTSGACLKTIGSGEGRIVLRDCHFELNTGYIIDNDGANVFMEGFWALSTSELAWIRQSSGNTFVRGGTRASWTANKLAKITGGTIVMEPWMMYMAARLASEGVVVVPTGGAGAGFGNAIQMVAAGSNGGKIVLPSCVAFQSQTGVALTAVSNASPGPITGSLWYQRDGNNRVWDFAITTSVAGTDNILRIDITNGVSTIRNDVHLPAFVGGGHLRITNIVGVGGAAGIFAIEGYFAETASGKITRIHQSVADEVTALACDRALVFTSIKTGATASTITVDQLTETVTGPTFVGL